MESVFDDNDDDKKVTVVLTSIMAMDAILRRGLGSSRTTTRRLLQSSAPNSSDTPIDVSYTLVQNIMSNEEPSEAFRALAQQLTDAVTGGSLGVALTAELGTNVSLDPSTYVEPQFSYPPRE